MLENDCTFIFHFAKIICKPNSVFVLDFLEVFHIHKNHNNVVNCDFSITPLWDCWKSVIKFNFSWFFLLYQALQVSFNSDFLLINPLAPPPYSWIHWKTMFTVWSKIIRALQIIRVKKLIPNEFLWNKLLNTPKRLDKILKDFRNSGISTSRKLKKRYFRWKNM